MSRVEEANPGLTEATERLNNKMGGGKEIKKLPEHLHPGEEVHELSVGARESEESPGFGVLALTDRRVLFVFDGLVFDDRAELPLERIDSVWFEHDGGLDGSKVRVRSTGREEIDVKGMEGGDAQRFSDTARRLLGLTA